MSLFRWSFWGWLYNLAWPGFDCADCNGMKAYGCECAYYEAGSPGTAPGEALRWLRWLHGFIYLETSPYWKNLR